MNDHSNIIYGTPYQKNQSKYPSSDEWTHNVVCSYHRISLIIKKKKSELLIDATMWMNLESIMLIESQSVRSVAQSCPTFCDPMNRSTPGLPVHHQLLEFTQTHVHLVGDAIQPSLPLSSPSPPASNPSQHQGLFQWISSLHEVAEVLEFQPQHQSFQWTPRADLL